MHSQLAAVLRVLALSSLFGCTAAAVANAPATRNADDAAISTAASGDHAPGVPLFLSGAHPDRQGLVRLINHSDRSGMVHIHAIDDAGQRFGPVAVRLHANAARHLTSQDLEMGNPRKNLATGIGSGHGDWRLTFDTVLDISALSYAQMSDGFLAPLGGTITDIADSACRIDFFNSASSHGPTSLLRLTNAGTEDAEIAIEATDDRGQPAPGGAVRIALPAGASRTVSADDLESGSADLAGSLGDGAGKWRLSVSAEPYGTPVQVTNLLSGASGDLAVPAPCTPDAVIDAGIDDGTGIIDQMDGAVVVAPDGTDDWGSDPYELASVDIEGDMLLATLSYGGGCEDHVFTLVLSDSVRMTDPVRLPARIAHEANGDACEAWLTSERSFDLQPVRELHGGDSGTVILVLTTPQDEQIEVTYTF